MKKIFCLRRLFQNANLRFDIGFGTSLSKNRSKPGFSIKSREAVPKAEVLERPLRRRLFALLILGAVSFPLGAQGFFNHFSWSLKGSVLFFPEDNGPTVGAPMPILGAFGGGAAYNFWGPLSAEFSLDIYLPYYNSWGYDYNLDRAIPVEWENRSASVYGFVTGLLLSARFPLGKTASVRVFGGPAADLRIVALSSDLNSSDYTGDPATDPKIQTEAVKHYFWSKGRWFLPVFGSGMDFNLSPKIKLGFDLRVWFPVYRLWSGENLPGIEGWRFGVGVRLTFRREEAPGGETANAE
jgi:hypothetical protein